VRIHPQASTCWYFLLHVKHAGRPQRCALGGLAGQRPACRHDGKRFGAQEKRSAYAPGEDQPVRYDGIYRIARAYRKPGAQGKLVCRYLFMRCDNEPAPWSSEGAAPGPSLTARPAPAACVLHVQAWPMPVAGHASPRDVHDGALPVV